MTWATASKKATKQMDACVKIARTFLLPTYGSAFYVFREPVHPAVAMLYCAHESGRWNKRLKRWECLRWVKTSYPEIGLLQLTMRQGDNEVAKWGVDPLDPLSHIWAAQASFADGVSLTRRALETFGYKPFQSLLPTHATALLLLVRSVGIGCVRGLLRNGAKVALDPIRPFHSIAVWLQQETADTSDFDGVQDTYKVRLRFLWCWQCVSRAPEVGIGTVGASVAMSAAPRPRTGLVKLPADFQRNVDAYIDRAKSEGYNPTGAWPHGVMI